MDDNTQDQTTEEVKAESSDAEAMEDKETTEAPVEETQAEEAPAEEVETPAEEVKTEEAPQPVVDQPVAEKKEAKAVSSNLATIIESIEKLSVLELADLVHALEDKFGVTAAAPMAVAAAPAGAGQAAGEPAEEQTSFNVILTGAGANKIAVIKAVRELVPTLGLKEAKDLVEATPKPVLEGVNKDAANEAKEKLTAAGGTVELQ